MTGRKKTTGTNVDKYKICKTFSENVNKALLKKGGKIKVSYTSTEGENDHWQRLARAMLKESADVMNIKGMSICVGVADRFSPSEAQKKAIVAIAKQHCPKVYRNIDLLG